MQKCPGQDTRYWKPEDSTEVKCGKCGHLVEFFKTDGARRCPKCGSRVVNPAVSLGCAQWCAHAKDCLGFDPKSLQVVEREGDSMSNRLIEAMKAEFGADQKRITHGLNVLEQAEAIQEEEGGEPRIVIAAALLHDIGIQEAERKHGSPAPAYQEQEGPPIARRILESLGFDEQSTEHVCRIVANHHSARDIDTLEFRVIWDADWLVNLRDDSESYSPDKLKDLVERVFKTPAGKRRGQELFAMLQAARL